MLCSNFPGVLLFIMLFADVLVIEGKSILELRMIRRTKLFGIVYEYDSSILVCSLHIIKSHTHPTH